jgi:alpha-L-rhamnosidase
MGEYQDYTVETAGWLTCQDEGPWRPVVVQENTLKLSPQIAEPMQVVKSLKPQSVEVLDSSIIVDFGQNLVGRIRLTLADSARGASIKIFHGEMLDNGDLYNVNLRSAEAMDAVVAPGGPFVFEPLFTLHGFRYVKIEGLGKQAGSASVEALVVSSALEETGRVATSSSLVNRLLANIEWSQRGNFVGIPTDCNQRDERLGWTADAQIFAPTASFNSHVEAFFDSWLRDLMSSQRADGCIPDVAPLPPTSYNFGQGAPAWADAATIVPWNLYKTYGDLAKLRSFFPMMKAWVDYVASVNPPDGWINSLGNNYGDWLSVNANTPKTVVSLAYRIHSVDIVALAADALGMSDLAERYRLSAKELREGFVTKFISDEGAVHGETQTGYLFALAWDIAPSHLIYKLVARLVKNIRDNGNLLSTGFLGVNLLCPTLTRFGHQDLAVDLLMEERFPSWGYSISQGATTIWERWDGWTEANGFHTPTMNSFNHYSLGSVGEWVYRQLAGIDQTRDSVAYKDIFVEPIFTPRLDYVEAEFESPRGRIKSAWYREGSTYRLEVEVPPGSQATVRLGGKDHVVESGSHQLLGIEK